MFLRSLFLPTHLATSDFLFKGKAGWGERLPENNASVNWIISVWSMSVGALFWSSWCKIPIM